jgi:hypothetical protein
MEESLEVCSFLFCNRKPAWKARFEGSVAGFDLNDYESFSVAGDDVGLQTKASPVCF